MDIYRDTNKFLEECFHSLETEAPSPVITDISGEKVLRYEGKNIEAAIIQKLARYISGLNASLLLLNHGYTQELGALFRMLDEFNEDIVFLSLPKLGHEYTKLHAEFLDSFYQEEFDPGTSAIQSEQKRSTIRRSRIISAISNSKFSALNPSDSQNLHRTLSQAYSGYVHGASVHINEMVSGPPFRYHLSGMPDTVRQQEFLYNYWDFSYRGILAVMCSAKALGNEDIAQKALTYRDNFEQTTGYKESDDPEKLMREFKKKKKVPQRNSL